MPSSRPSARDMLAAEKPQFVVLMIGLHDRQSIRERPRPAVRPGQPATIHVDTYPDAKCSGKVTCIAQATGAEFAVLPPQNASGNWVKVVQRIPVRTSVQCREGDPPLRVGMSTTIEIDTGHKRSFGDILKAIGL